MMQLSLFCMDSNICKILLFVHSIASSKIFCYSNIVIDGTDVPAERGPYMTELDHLKTQIHEAVQAAQDADLLDLILKLLITET